MSGWRVWFADRTLREQRLLIVMAAMLVLLLLWAGIVMPVTDGLASARERHADAVLRLAATQTRVEEITRLGRHPAPPLTGSLDQAVRASADQAGFTLQTVNALGPDRVQVGLASARGGALMAWVSGLEQQGILVDTMDLHDNGDRTLAATLTLRARR